MYLDPCTPQLTIGIDPTLFSFLGLARIQILSCTAAHIQTQVLPIIFCDILHPSFSNRLFSLLDSHPVPSAVAYFSHYHDRRHDTLPGMRHISLIPLFDATRIDMSYVILSPLIPEHIVPPSSGSGSGFSRTHLYHYFSLFSDRPLPLQTRIAHHSASHAVLTLQRQCWIKLVVGGHTRLVDETEYKSYILVTACPDKT